jgi:hypothetical protein
VEGVCESGEFLVALENFFKCIPRRRVFFHWGTVVVIVVVCLSSFVQAAVWSRQAVTNDAKPYPQNIVSPGFFETKMGASANVVNEANRMAVLGRQGMRSPPHFSPSRPVPLEACHPQLAKRALG